MLAEKIVRMLVGLWVGFWVARYLGPERFGVFSYAQSFVGLFSAFATLGLDGIVIRELVKDEHRNLELIGSAFGLKLLGAILVLIMLGFAVILTSNDLYTNLIIFIIASATIFQSFNVVDMYFQSKVMSRYAVYANMATLLISSLIKIVLILNDAPLIAFAWVVLFDSLVLACGLLYFFIRYSGCNLGGIKFNVNTAISLLKDSWLMALAGAAILVYMKIDQLMIKEMVSSEAVGFYAAAVRISEAWYFIPMAIASSLFPAVVNAKKQCEKLYYARLQNLYNLIVAVAIGIALPMVFLSDWIIHLLYGDKYYPASDVLMIHIWAGVFVFLSVVNDMWFYTENKALLLTIKVTIGAASNIILNLYLIPLYGVKGAAIATILSYSISVMWSDMFFKDIGRLFFMKIKALFFYDQITFAVNYWRR